jgi:hypothetical protein
VVCSAVYDCLRLAGNLCTRAGGLSCAVACVKCVSLEVSRRDTSADPGRRHEPAAHLAAGVLSAWVSFASALASALLPLLCCC